MKDDVLYRELPDSFDERVPPVQATAPPKSHRWDISIGSLVCLLAPTGVLLAFVPKFADVYAQIKVHRPPLTSFLLGLSHFACEHLWLVGIALILIPWSLGRLKGRTASLATVIISILGVAIPIGMLSVICLPLMRLLEGLHSSRY
jgi:hypothetical protein